ncbi:MAG: Stp1/IreP family PP2C-type Ser/Thr phosphatase [Ignavibacteria bacterium]|nr:Stp1/IreP family PP2C-type Ser/Thr phosphatase [Ignavibacteria bacterium]
MKLSYIYSSRTGLRRNTNEDFVDVFEVDDGLLAVVCDGLGGNNAGEVASQLAVSNIYSSFMENTLDEIPVRISMAVLAANRAIIEASEKTPDYKGMATTVVTLFINQHAAYWGHVGDSRIYYWEENVIRQITKDHSVVQKLLDEGLITAKEADKHPHKNVIMRALGDKSNVMVDTDTLELQKAKRWKFLLCSDGVSNVISSKELENLLKNNDLEQMSKTLSAMIEDRGAPDNYSYVIISNQTHN